MYNRSNFIGLETDRFIAEAKNASTRFEFGSKSHPLREPLSNPSLQLNGHIFPASREAQYIRVYIWESNQKELEVAMLVL